MKSTVTCPKCGNINITFDPFNTLNLNIPETKQKHRYYSDYINRFDIFYVPKYNLRSPVRVIYLDILKKAKFKDCVRCLKNDKDFYYHEKINKMLLTSVESNKKTIKYIYENDEKDIEDYDDDNYYFAYDINEKENKLIPVYFKEPSGLSIFPRIITVSEKESTMEELRKKIYINLRKLILSPFLNNDEEVDELSQKIQKYAKDYEIKDDDIINLIDKEYQSVFNKNENEKIKNFLEDIPFQLYLIENIKKDGSEKIYIINKDNFYNLPEQFIEYTKIKSYKDSTQNLIKLIEEKGYNLVLEFDTNSKYINSTLFKLNTCSKYKINYVEEAEFNQDSDSGIVTLKKCFDLFSKEEKLKDGDEWYCPICKDHVLANKKMELYYTPKILIICFKRFIKHYSYWERNDENIIFPINNLDMKEFIVGPDKEHSVYDLFAVSQHYGGTGGGHYTAVCKNFGKWYSYDDSSVHETSANDAISSAAYVLFYRRRTD